MNFEIELVNILKSTSNKNPAFIRNVIKEILQDFSLNYIYNSKYNNLVFTGGTCLRKIYGLDRLSEDLDFDYIEEFNIEQFRDDIQIYYKNSLKLDTQTTISGNNQTVFIKIPMDSYKSIIQNLITSDVLFLRCDFSNENKGGYEIETNPITAGSFTFFVKNYNLQTLFANKIVAFLERSFFKGKTQKVPFKGRDIYDLFWLISLSAKSSFKIRPNTERLRKLTGKDNLEDVVIELKNKLKSIDPKFVLNDLYPLVESEMFLKEFVENYESYISEKIDFILPRGHAK